MDRHEFLEEIKRLMNSKGLTPYAVAKNGGMVGSSIYTAHDDKILQRFIKRKSGCVFDLFANIYRDAR